MSILVAILCGFAILAALYYGFALLALAWVGVIWCFDKLKGFAIRIFKLIRTS